MNSHNNKIACIFGGTGFLGRHIVQELARAGYQIKIATRVPESAYDLKPYGGIGQIVPLQCDYRDSDSIKHAVQDCDVVINLVGILYCRGKNNFKYAHIDIPEKIAEACMHASVKKFIHVSALGIEKAKSKYAKSKLKGEEAVKKIFPDATILRPSVIFGAGDNFFNMLARLSTLSPVLPLINNGKTKFQPVYVGDVATAMVKIISDKTKQFSGQTYELGGPEVVSFKEIYDRVLEQTRREKKFLKLSWVEAKIQGFFMGLMPKPLLTMDQVRSLKTDSIIDENAQTLLDLGIYPTAMSSIIPQYLSCYRRGGRFADKKCA
ncbi:MAG: complex I NDUFA9 subunit family protein [Alphaproteobacteria bacterium]|nr:complex I NDUFA9 subunit family protein [Alphaproteobacteria bacterium]